MLLWTYISFRNIPLPGYKFTYFGGLVQKQEFEDLEPGAKLKLEQLGCDTFENARWTEWLVSVLFLACLVCAGIMMGFGFTYGFQWRGRFREGNCSFINISTTVSSASNCQGCLIVVVSVEGAGHFLAVGEVTPSSTISGNFGCSSFKGLAGNTSMFRCWIPPDPVDSAGQLNISSCFLTNLARFVVITSSGEPLSSGDSIILGVIGVAVGFSVLVASVPWCLCFPKEFLLFSKVKLALLSCKSRKNSTASAGCNFEGFSKFWITWILCGVFWLSHGGELTTAYLDAIIGLFIAFSFDEFNTVPWLLIILVVFVLISDYPRKRSMQFFDASFWKWRVAALVFETGQLVSGGLSLTCETGLGIYRLEFCLRPVGSFQRNEFAILVLSIAVIEASIKLSIHMLVLFSKLCALLVTYVKGPNIFWFDLVVLWIYSSKGVLLEKFKDY